MTTPNIVDIDRAASRSGIIGKIMNQANKEWVDKMTGYWSFLTLAGPRYAVRNATEDLMVHLAIGGSPWGLAKSRYLSTRVNTALEGARKTDGWNDNPLGLLMRVLNKNEAKKYEAELTALDDSIRTAKEQIGLKSAAMKIETDPNVKKTLASEIGGAALAQGLQTGVTRAEELAGYGVTKDQAQQGFQTVAGIAPRGGQLASIYGENPYTQATAEAEVFNTAGAAESAALRKKLTKLEQAQFAGSAGMAGGALSRDRASSQGVYRSAGAGGF